MNQHQQMYRPPTSFGIFPPVVKNLLIINVLFAIATYTPQMHALLLKWLALWPINTPPNVDNVAFYPWQLVSYGFLHGGFNHLFLNMLGLWMFGMELENNWGSKRFSIFYFTCLIGAGLIQLLVTQYTGDIYPTVGASGGVYGVLLAFAMMYPNRKIYLYFFIPVKSKWLVLGLGLFALYSGFSGAQDNVAHFAHLGGMVFGFVLIQYWRGKLPFEPKF